MKIMKILVSSCLIGINCKYNGENNLSKEVINLTKKHILIPVCPEQLGGLSTPRAPSEIKNGDGMAVLKGHARVFSEDGHDLSIYFIKGAKETLKIARLLNIDIAIMKERSPSCGVNEIYDGSFSHTKIKGCGVTVALLKKEGFTVFSEKEIEKIENMQLFLQK